VGARAAAGGDATVGAGAAATHDGGVGTSGAARPREQCAGDDMGAGAAARAADQLRARVIDRGVGR